MFYELNKNVKKLRNQKKMTMKELGEQLNIKTLSVSNIESGKRNCSIEVLVRLSKIFEISIDDLIFKEL